MQLQQPLSATDRRHYGVDALRILSIFMVLNCSSGTMPPL